MNTTTIVREGKDVTGRRLVVEGVVPLDRKVTTKDTRGGMLIYEHKNVGRGGPPKHLHFNQDEWLYVLEGEFVVEIGDERFTLKKGDSVLAPRQVPHAWAHVSPDPGTLLFVAQPAGEMEPFFEKLSSGDTLTPEQLDELYTATGMKLIGPPMDVNTL